MMERPPPAPTGLTRRSRRLSGEETRDRMLRAAIEMINQKGLTVSLDHISFEEVIRSADVPRSTAYRHWPYKDLFISDLITELARTAGPTIIRDEIRLIRQILAAHPDWLDTPETRHGLLLELIRQLSLLDLQAVLASPGWRTYLALHATFSSLADGEVREQVQTALTQAEAAHTARVAQAWGQLAGLFGYRLRPELATTFDTLATLVGATMRGLVITALSNPDVVSHATLASPFGAASKDEWSLASVGIASIAMAFLEPDPTAQWDEQRLAEIHRVLDAWDAEDP
jgi:AcrR family transcriptional regulator